MRRCTAELHGPGLLRHAARLVVPCVLALGLLACSLDPSTPPATPATPPRPTPQATRIASLALAADAAVPGGALARVAGALQRGARPVAEAGDPAQADVRLAASDLPGATRIGTWYYALAAPFFTLDDDIALTDLQGAWRSSAAQPSALPPLLAAADTVRVFTALWGPPGDAVRTVDPATLLSEAQNAGAWAILPFDELQIGWKPLRIDGISLLEKGLNAGAARYPLQVPLVVAVREGAPRAEVLQLLGQGPDALSNRREEQMTIVAMTGVSCPARTTGLLMQRRGLTYPGQDIKEWLVSADLTHISNELSFTPDCPNPPPQDTMSFCAHDSYIKLLQDVGTDIIELTGNHVNDYGREPLRHTLALYQSLGWKWFGGGANLAEAQTPLTIVHGPNRLAFLGCNPVGPFYAWATESEPGSCPCDLERMQAQVAELRAQGYLPIVTFQHWEVYEYAPSPQQMADFRAMADAGAVFVQGSQAHQPQTMEIRGESFIHYGLGNLFFDQMQTLGTRQEFVDRLVFYEGRLLSVDLRTAMLEEYGRPRPMTPEERRQLLQTVFAVRPTP